MKVGFAYLISTATCTVHGYQAVHCRLVPIYTQLHAVCKHLHRRLASPVGITSASVSFETLHQQQAQTFNAPDPGNV